MPHFVALLRGINVAGTNRIPMAPLRALFLDEGYTDVETYLQSGNVIFTTPNADATPIAQALEDSIQRVFGVACSVLLRDAAALKAILNTDPYTPAQLTTPNTCIVVFLAQAPEAEPWQALLDWHTGTETLQLHGRELYAFYPDGSGRSKLTLAIMERKLCVVGTGRNWNTVVQLHQRVARA